jgi:ribose transport system permease protein
VAVTGLEQLGADLWVEPVFQGAVLFVAVGLSAWTTRFRAQRARQARLRELEERRAAQTPPAEAPSPA